MEFVGTGVLLFVSTALLMALLWVALAQNQRAGLWWALAGLVIASCGRRLTVSPRRRSPRS